jgi:hypothetical protein
MAKKYDFLILLAIPLLSYIAVGFGLGYGIYHEELASGNSSDEAIKWAFCFGMLLSPIGAFPGILLMILWKAIITELRERKRKKGTPTAPKLI